MGLGICTLCRDLHKTNNWACDHRILCVASDTSHRLKSLVPELVEHSYS